MFRHWLNTSQSRICLSWPPLASRRPSGLNLQPNTSPQWPVSCKQGALNFYWTYSFYLISILYLFSFHLNYVLLVLQLLQIRLNLYLFRRTQYVRLMVLYQFYTRIHFLLCFVFWNYIQIWVWIRYYFLTPIQIHYFINIMINYNFI